MLAFFAPAYLAVSVAILLWDIVLAGQIAQLRSAPRPFAVVTAFAGLLIAPAALIAVTSASILNGRAIYVIGWVWPATLALFAVQAIYATGRGLVTPLIGVPIAVYDVILALASAAGYASARGAALSDPMLALAAAHATALGYVTGPAALFSPLAIQLPLLSPAYPARWRISKTVRASLALLAAAWVTLTVMELPRGVRTITSYRRFDEVALRERPEGDFAVGLKLFPDLEGAPPPLAVRSDLALADTTDPDAVMVVVDPAGVTPAALDSLGRTLEEVRSDSVPLIVALGYARDARQRHRDSPAAYMAARVEAIDQIVRRLRPDYIFPAEEPYGRGARALGRLSAGEWAAFLTAAADRAHRLRPRTKVGMIAAGYDARDSAPYAWAARRRSPVDVLGFAIVPSFRGGLGVQARTQAADRWMRAAGSPTKEHWIVASGYPATHGDANQERAIWGALAWATARPAIRGLVVAEAGDYDDQRGLRMPGGQLRPAVRAVGRAVRGLRETVSQ